MEFEELKRLIFARIQDATNVNEEDLQDIVRRVMNEHNNMPLDGAEGLTPSQLFDLSTRFLDGGKIITLNTNIRKDLALTSPMLVICMKILQAIPENKTLKLTATGALPVKLVREVYDACILPYKSIGKRVRHLNKELDWPVIHMARILCELSGLARKTKGKWTLTAKGRKALTSPATLLKTLFTNYCIKFNWSYLDGYDSDIAGQLGFGYSLFLLHKYGQKEMDTTFYAKKSLQAFPMAADGFSSSPYFSKLDQFSSCYIYRTFSCCLHWFGLVDLQETGYRYNDDFKQTTSTSSLFKEFIVVNIDGPDMSSMKALKSTPGTKPEGLQNELLPPAGDVKKPIGFQPKTITTPKSRPTGRNEQCPCGSGKKYKHCCARNL